MKQQMLEAEVRDLKEQLQEQREYIAQLEGAALQGHYKIATVVDLIRDRQARERDRARAAQGAGHAG